MRRNRPARTAPSSWAATKPSSLRPSMRRKTQSMRVRAGLRPPPEARCVAVRATARVSPSARAIAVTSSRGWSASAATHTTPPPTKTRANVPISSARQARSSLLSMNPPVLGNCVFIPERRGESIGPWIARNSSILPPGFAVTSPLSPRRPCRRAGAGPASEGILKGGRHERAPIRDARSVSVPVGMQYGNLSLSDGGRARRGPSPAPNQTPRRSLTCASRPAPSPRPRTCRWCRVPPVPLGNGIPPPPADGPRPNLAPAQLPVLPPVPAPPAVVRQASADAPSAPPSTDVGPKAASLRELQQQAASWYAGVDSYIVRMTRREVVSGTAKPEEVLMLVVPQGAVERPPQMGRQGRPGTRGPLRQGPAGEQDPHAPGGRRHAVHAGRDADGAAR